MSLIRFVHHIQFACKNVWHSYEMFASCFGYKLHCQSKHGSALNLVLENGKSLFMLSEKVALGSSTSNRYISELSNNCMTHERPFDIAFEVSDVNRVCQYVRELNGSDSILLEPFAHSDYHGKVQMAVIKSCINGLLHTVINSSDYRGRFLPGYILPEFNQSDQVKRHLDKKHSGEQWNRNATVSHLDHVALACDTGQSQNVIKWYAKVFGMTRIAANVFDDEKVGFVVKYKDSGMQLRAMDNHDCHKSSLTTSDASLKIVVVEPLKESAPNQVSQYLAANGGPGLQHLGLAVDDILDTASDCRAGGLQFVEPPHAYYEELLKSPVLGKLSMDLEKLQQSGVLLDTEVIDRGSSKEIAYLLQIFTKPLFEPNGFFMELIERRSGASGFGANNIIALWKANEATTRPTRLGDNLSKRSPSSN